MNAPRIIRGRRIWLLLTVACFLPTWQAVGQSAEDDDRIQTLEIDAGPVNAVGIGYTRVFEPNQFRGGVRVWYSFEERTRTFSHNVWDVFGLDVYGRRVFNREALVDLGFSLLGFAPEDDTDESGTFTGVYGAASFGHKYVFVTLALRVGVSSLRDEMRFGLIASPRIKLKLDF